MRDSIFDVLAVWMTMIAVLIFGRSYADQDQTPLQSLYHAMQWLVIPSLIGWLAVRLVTRLLAAKLPDGEFSRVMGRISGEWSRSVTLLTTTVTAAVMGMLMHSYRLDLRFSGAVISVALGVALIRVIDAPIFDEPRSWWYRELEMDQSFPSAGIAGVIAALLAGIVVMAVALIR